MIMTVSTAALAIAMISLSGALRTKQTRLEANRIVQNAFEGDVDVVRDMAARGVLRPPQSLNLHIGSCDSALQITDVSGQSFNLLGISITTTAPTLLVAGTVSYRGSAYRLQRVIGRGRISTVWQYALYSDSALASLSSAVTTGSPGLEGSMWVGGTLTLLNASTHIAGDLTATGLIVPSNMNVDGQRTSGAASITFPGITDSDYKNAAGVTKIGDTVLNGYTFLSPDANGYPLYYCSDNLSISGAFSGTGVIFSRKNITITGDVTTGIGNHLVIIAVGNVTIAASAVHVSAYIYAGGTFTVSNSRVKRYLTGGVVANNVSLGDSANFAFDPLVRDNPVEAYNLKLPGVWP